MRFGFCLQIIYVKLNALWQCQQSIYTPELIFVHSTNYVQPIELWCCDNIICTTELILVQSENYD